MPEKDKVRLRKFYLKERDSLDEAYRALVDRGICRRAILSSSFSGAEDILVYSPVGSEIDVGDITRAALERGKRVFFPYCIKKEKKMVFYRVRDIDSMRLGAYGIPEPDTSAERYDTASGRPAVVFLPGLIYDYGGFRIGYGGGYYDRFLPCFSGTKIGLAREGFILDGIPHDEFDIPADIIITEKEEIIVGK